MATGHPFGGDSQPLLIIFFLMHTFGWTFSLLMLLTIVLAKNVHRNAAWMNLCASWVIACISFSLLLLTGQIGLETPNHAVCLIQASLVFSASPLAAGATLALALQIWLNIRPQSDTGIKTKTHLSSAVIRKVTLLALPYLVPVSLLVGVFSFGLLNPQLVHLAPHGLYCGVQNRIPGTISAIYVACCTVTTLVFEGLVIASLYKSYRQHQLTAAHGTSTIVRLVIFTLFGVFAIGITLSYLSGGNLGRLPNVLESLPPVSFVIVFFTQMDILHALMFWRAPDGSTRSVSGLFKKRHEPGVTTSMSTMQFETASRASGPTQFLDMSDENDVEKYAGLKPLESSRVYSM